MEIVIKIPKEYYETLKEMSDDSLLMDTTIIKYGTPLPEHHGRLIDADWVKNILDLYTFNFNGIYGQFIRREDIDGVPTIIEGE